MSDKLRDTVANCIDGHQLSRYNLDFSEHEYSDNDLLEDDLRLDSLDVMEVIMAVEDALYVKVPDKKIHDIRTFGDLCNLFDKCGV